MATNFAFPCTHNDRIQHEKLIRTQAMHVCVCVVFALITVKQFRFMCVQRPQRVHVHVYVFVCLKGIIFFVISYDFIEHLMRCTAVHKSHRNSSNLIN